MACRCSWSDLFKKLALANYLAFYVERVYEIVQVLSERRRYSSARSLSGGRSYSISVATPIWRAAWPK